MNPLIRTGFRERLPKGFSHPLGAEILSHEFADYEFYNDLWIAFGKSEWYQISDKHSNYKCVFSIVLNYVGGGKYLSVSAVPSQFNKSIKENLSRFGLPEAKKWLFEKRPENWKVGCRVFSIGIDNSSRKNRICFYESKNSKEISLKEMIIDEEK